MKGITLRSLSMPVLVRIAFRNMIEHKAKSAIIGILIALGVVVIVLGNALMDSAAEGVRSSFIESFTGDLMIHGPSDKAITVFGVESMSMDADTETPTVPEYEKILAKVRSDPRVATATSMAVAYGLLAIDADETIEDSAGDGRENVSFAIVFGVEADSYFKMFPAVKIVKGRAVKTGESAVMLTQKQIEKLEKKYKRTFALGDKVLITGFGTAGMRIRETEIVGVYQRADDSGSPAPFIFTDIDTARVLGGLVLGTDEDVKLDASQTALLSASGEDALFGDGADDMVGAAPVKGAKTTFDSAAKLLGDTSKRDLLNKTDSGAWHFILARLKDSNAAPGAIVDYTRWFKDSGIDAKITDWKGAAGSFGKFADIVRVVFNVALIVISIVSVIIMMNTLVISVIERTSEIGTMRALGAQSNFVSSMFLTETLTLTVVFGFIGSIVAILATLILNALKIPATNDLLKLLFGGEVLHLVPRFSSFVTTIVMVFAVGWLAHLYPVRVALKIQPVKAMQTE
ncbi:MAG: FtsX-like permease family protein [Treponemataceae bacterium]